LKASKRKKKERTYPKKKVFLIQFGIIWKRDLDFSLFEFNDSKLEPQFERLFSPEKKN